MSTYFFSALSNGQSLPFNATTDLLYFDAPGISAASLAVSTFDATTAQLIAAGKTIRLRGLTLETMDSWNLMFADGSRLLVGDDSSGNSSSDAYSNQLSGGDFNDRLLGLGGDDTLNGGLGNDALDGGTGTDTASYEDAAVGVVVNLGTTGPQNTVGAGSDTLISIENLLGSAFDDTLTGDAGANTLQGLGGNDVLNGGVGNDTASYGLADGAITVSLATAAAQNTGGAGTDTLSNFENLVGSGYSDRLTGDAGNNILDGGYGNDTLTGGAGSDSLYGGYGSDSLVGGAGNDFYYVDNSLDQVAEDAGAGTDTVFSSVSWTLGANLENLTLTSASYTASGTGNTLNNVIQGNSSDNLLNGGAGNDTVSYAGASAGVNVNLGFSNAQNTGWGRDTLRNFENITGGAFNDRLFGDAKNNLLDGADGNDLLLGGAGNDSLSGGAGTDTASYFTAPTAVKVSLLTTAGQNTGGAGVDTLSGIEALQGSAFNDTLTGNASDNVLEGMAGNDVLNGGAGVDTASYASASAAVKVSLAVAKAQNTGGAGNDTLTNFENLVGSGFDDTLTGGAGVNLIDGGAGGDRMAGGTGDDTYRVDSGGGFRLAMVNGSQALVVWDGASDTVAELAGQGTDTVETYCSFTLPDNVETLTALDLVSTGTGSVQRPALTLTGNDLNNLIVDNLASNTINGGGGIDTVSFERANTSYQGVTVYLTSYSRYANGGNGYDQLTGIENIIGSSANDSFYIDGVGDRYDGGAGVDLLSYVGIPSTFDSGTGTYTYAKVTVNLGLTGPQDTGGVGTDTILNFENLTGGSGNDTLTGNSADNVLMGSHGNDVLDGAAGNDTLYGYSASGTDAGIDTASYASAPAGVEVSLGLATPQNTGGAGIDTLIGIANLTGSAFGDTLTGEAGANTLDGLAGDDTLVGGAGRDSLLGGAGDDDLSGDVGDDTLIGGAGNDTLTGGDGLDLADYTTAVAAVAVNLASGGVSGGAGNDSLMGIENLIGCAFADNLTGDAGANHLTGLAGNDTLNGAGGNDTLIGAAGDDVLNGGAGIDTLDYSGATAAVTVDLGSNSAQDTGGAGIDTISNVENLSGSAFNDTLTGNGSDNLVDGGAGNNTLTGGAGTDTLSYASMSRPTSYDPYTLYVNLADGKSVYNYSYPYYPTNDTLSGFENITGSSGRDLLTGDSVANLLAGGSGADTLVGGGGADVFRFVTTGEGVDTLSDFTSGLDQIQVVGGNFGGLPVGTLTEDRFKTAGMPLTTANAVFLYDANTGALSFDSDGNGSAAAVQIASLTGLKALLPSDIQIAAA